MYLVRHGETHSNRLQRYAGCSEEPLTQSGREQIRALAERLRSHQIGEIWTSEIARARESADILAHILGVPTGVEHRLNEMRMGPWEGFSETEVAERFPEAYALWCRAPDQLRMDGRETLAAVAWRMASALEDAAARASSVLFATHVAPIRCGLLTALGLPLRYYRRLTVENAACFVLDEEGAHRLENGHSVITELTGDGFERPSSSVSKL
ncbi:MAG: histidine phosphatase family protein [Gemmatimonadetes bacterium]|nr:histidine phosphatase family protein [Gemmatimonadota bacterium]